MESSKSHYILVNDNLPPSKMWVLGNITDVQEMKTKLMEIASKGKYIYILVLMILFTILFRRNSISVDYTNQETIVHTKIFERSVFYNGKKEFIFLPILNLYA